jgi:inhibitor of KinA
MAQHYRLHPLGDAVILIEFGNCINDAVSERVLHLFHQLKQLSPFIRDVVPAYSSLAVYYDVAALHKSEKTAYESIKELVEPLLENLTAADNTGKRKMRIPVCYTGKFAPDIEELAAAKNLSVEELIRLHTAKEYRVYMIGFLPGFPYMGTVDSRIAAPRKSSPRLVVPAGSVGIAGQQTGIYPLSSPGGWNIIGRTPLQLFDAVKSEPALLEPGDRVCFYSITENEFENY